MFNITEQLFKKIKENGEKKIEDAKRRYSDAEQTLANHPEVYEYIENKLEEAINCNNFTIAKHAETPSYPTYLSITISIDRLPKLLQDNYNDIYLYLEILKNKYYVSDVYVDFSETTTNEKSCDKLYFNLIITNSEILELLTK
jgi:hypothetical protein